MLYHAVLAGKTNAGKSSLFNVLTRTQKAIVSAEENVTRDVNTLPVKSEAGTWLLSDMAGLGESGEGFFDLTQIKARELMESADLLLVLFDIHSIDRDDRHVIKMARQLDKPVLYIANKADNETDDLLLADFAEAGLADVIPVSCKTMRHQSRLRGAVRAVFENLKAKGIKPLGWSAPADDCDFSISIIGRPNAGKSSLLNFFLGKNRSIVSDVPGTTRDSVMDHFTFKGKNLRIIDTAGLRKRKTDKDEVEQFSVRRTTQSLFQSDCAVLVVDAGEGLADQDKKISSVAVNHHKALIIAVNKWDIAAANGWKWNDFHKELMAFFPHLKKFPVMPVSCLTGKNVNELLEVVLQTCEAGTLRISTGELNRLIEKLVKASPPKAVKGHALKIYYAVQIDGSPPLIRIYVNNKDKLQENYRNYIENGFRESRDLSGVPFVIQYVERGQEDSSKKAVKEEAEVHNEKAPRKETKKIPSAPAKKTTDKKFDSKLTKNNKTKNVRKNKKYHKKKSRYDKSPVKKTKLSRPQRFKD